MKAQRYPGRPLPDRESGVGSWKLAGSRFQLARVLGKRGSRVPSREPRVLFHARTLLCALLGGLLSATLPLSAQLAAPNKAGVAMGHLHYHVRDVEANKRFWLALGGTPVDARGRLPQSRGVPAADQPSEILRFADVMVVLTKGESSGGTEGSVVNHVAFRVPSLAPVEAAGLKVQRLQGFPGVASVMSPEGERIELFENAATNLTFTFDAGHADAVAERHNRPASVPIAFHHVHLYVPEGAVPEVKAWYARMFGATPGKRGAYEAVDLPGINFNFSNAPRPTVATRGRMLDHIGIEVSNLAAFCKRLEAMGVKLDVPYSTNPGGLSTASLTDPWGTSIELTEGLRGL
jgi:catechol 2,3-dioxygenase-like lactoylglutathione lyase family enzyme